jgi:Flp pilus assembly protein TadG
MTGRHRSPATVAGSDEGGVTLVLPMLLWVATLVAIVTIDIAGYLVAASRAQALADAAALAAVSADVALDGALVPVDEADRVVRAGDGQLEVCTCEPGSERARVTVSVPVPGLVIPRFGATRVAADATAVLAPPLPWDHGP